jgi:hypothetical protein
MTHELKTWRSYFQLIWDNKKPFELRKNDRGYKVGDTLYLREYNEGDREYTGRYIDAYVTCMVENAPEFGLMDGYCIMGISEIGRSGR